MALQDLTPQLRTRLSRVERAVGIFVLVATLLLLSGLTYYIYHTAARKGWFLRKLPYNTFVNSAAGLNVGDPIKMYGFNVGEITEVTAMPPFSQDGDVYVAFIVKHPYYDYIWDDSKTKVTSDFIGTRFIEIVPRAGGVEGKPSSSYKIAANNVIEGVWDDHDGRYHAYTNGHKGYSLFALESMPLNDRLDQVAKKVEAALPNILAMTNQINGVLSNSARAAENVDHLISEIRPVVSNANFTLLSVQPSLSNINVISTMLRNPKGSLGEWLIPTNLNAQLEKTLANANNAIIAATNTLGRADTTMHNTDTNLTYLVNGVGRSLDNLANLTSNLNAQVQANTNLVKEISDAIVHTDDLVQGLKKHWLLRSAFKTNAPPVKKK